ncbi:MAG: TRAP transporter small permease subunit [Rhizobiaceae bacterium]|nr:TRAP transporter small permease subunit [Rhizobiaceae bacterium]
MYQRLEFACAALLLASIVLLIGVAAVTRFMGAPIIWSIEVAQLLFVWLVMLAADLAMQQGRHFGLSLLVDILPPPAQRILEIVNYLIVLALILFLLVYAVRNAVLMHPRLIGATQMNGSLIHAAMPFGLLLMVRTLAVQLYERIRATDAV